MEEEIKKITEKFLNEQKKEGKFLDNILLEVAEFKYNKVYNLVIGLMGILSPTIQLILLFRKDLIDANNIISILIITIAVNAIIFVAGVLLNKVNRYSKLELNNVIIKKNLCKAKAKSYKLNKDIEQMIITQDSMIEKMNKKNINRISKIFIKIKYRYMKLSVKHLNERRKKNKNLVKKIDTLVEKNIDIEKNIDSVDDFKYAIITNIVVGEAVIIIKVLSYLGVAFIDFKYVIKVVVLFYAFTFGQFVLNTILKNFNKLIIIIYKFSKRKIKITKELELEYQQISMFEDGNIEL